MFNNLICFGTILIIVIFGIAYFVKEHALKEGLILIGAVSLAAWVLQLAVEHLAPLLMLGLSLAFTVFAFDAIVHGKAYKTHPFFTILVVASEAFICSTAYVYITKGAEMTLEIMQSTDSVLHAAAGSLAALWFLWCAGLALFPKETAEEKPDHIEKAVGEPRA